MSLTSFITSNKDYRDLVRNNFVKPKFDAGPLLAEPKTLNYGLVGTAFDYLLRFKIERENRCEANPWIASKLNQSPLVEKINTEARDLLNLYLKNGEMTNALMKSALKLATIDNVSRSGQGADQIGIINPLDIVDLSNLYKLIDIGKFKSHQYCYLNPTFGIGSQQVNGADADLIIDGTLIDIKTTKNANFSRSYFEQLIGYFLLHIIDCQHRNVSVSIQKLGIYFSRHGRLFLMDVANLIDESKLPNIVSAFKDLLSFSIPREPSSAFKDLLSFSIPHELSDEERARELASYEQTELEWAEPWSIAKEAGKNAIEANPSIKGSDLIKIINEKINKFLVSERSVPRESCDWILVGRKKSPSEILHEKSVLVAKAIIAQFKRKHLSVAEKELNKEKRKKYLATKKLAEQIEAGWEMAKKSGKNAKESNHLLSEEGLAKIIYKDIKNYLIEINCPQSIAESVLINGLGLWRKPRLLEAESTRLSKLIIAAFKSKQTRNKRRNL